MGKASSAKKVARAARAGGKKTSKQRQIGFPVAIFLVVALGLGLVVYARQSGILSSDSKNHPKVGEHWHASYGFYICDHFIANIPDGPTDTLGIHTHEDGLVHIHPFIGGAAGKQAKFARFFDQVGLKVTDTEIKLPKADPFKGRVYKEGQTTCNGKPATIQIDHWKSAQTSGTTKANNVYTSKFGDVRFTEDLGAFTIAFVSAGTKVPPPPGAADILQNATNDASPQPSSAGTTNTTQTVLTGGTTAPQATVPVTTAPAATVPATTAVPTSTP